MAASRARWPVAAGLVAAAALTGAFLVLRAPPAAALSANAAATSVAAPSDRESRYADPAREHSFAPGTLPGAPDPAAPPSFNAVALEVADPAHPGPDLDLAADSDRDDDGALAPPAAVPDTVSADDLLRYGSKEPLVPPVVRLEVQLAPGSVATAEPLIPPLIGLDPVTLAPGSVATSEPPTPPVVAAGDTSVTH